MTANAASYLHIGPSEAGGSSDNITVRNCRQTGNEAGVLVIMRGGLCGWQVHSVRRKSCDADSSEEPSAGGGERGNLVRGCGDFGACLDGGRVRREPSWGSAIPRACSERGASSEARVRSLACPGLLGGMLEWGRASRLAPGKRQQASAVQGLRRGSWLGEGLVGALRAQGEL